MSPLIIKKGGVLILSEFAGAAAELGGAIIINPYDQNNVSIALKEALNMSVEEQIQRMHIMQTRLRDNDVHAWITELIGAGSAIKMVQAQMHAKILSSRMKKQLVADFKKASKRLLIFACDGVLMPYESKPEKVRPSKQLVSLLGNLCGDSKTQILLTSGREKETLIKWFGRLSLDFIAEGGVCSKEGINSWDMTELFVNDWKEVIRPVLERFVLRTPGTFIREREHSISWHFMTANDPIYAIVKAQELKGTLLSLIANLNLAIFEGEKVVEIKNAGVDIGSVALKWLKEKVEFILAIGGDDTFESLFSGLPENSYAIRVGLNPSLAKYNLAGTKEVVNLLQSLV